jgi:hypothetical protein
MGLEVQTTEPFDRNAVTLEGIPDAGQLVTEAFSAEAEVGGSYTNYVADPEGNRLFLLRVAERRDAPKEGYKAQFKSIREGLLSKRRPKFVQERLREVILVAKGISAEHMTYATSMRDGPGGVTGVKLRQIFLPPDRGIIGGWLDAAAKAKAETAQKAFAGGESWEEIVDRFSEDSATRGRRGELPASTRDELAGEYGNEFAEAVYELNEGDPAVLVKSKRGYHLIFQSRTSQDLKVFRHTFFSLDEKIRKLPADVRKRAEEASEQTLKNALAALEAGQSFGKVAKEFGSPDDAIGQGQEFDVDFVTEIERAALAQTLEWDIPDDHPQANDATWVPEAVAIKGPDGKESYHLFACARAPNDPAPTWNTKARRDRQVYHIQGSRAQVESARKELIEFIADAIEDDTSGSRPDWRDLIKEFQSIASERSTAPDKTKGGALGMVRLSEAVRGYGDEFLKRVAFKEDGSVVTKGYRPPVFRGEAGYHLVEVLDVTAKSPGDAERQSEVAELVLNGTNWN